MKVKSTKNTTSPMSYQMLTKDQFITNLAENARIILETIKAKSINYNGQDNPNPFDTYEKSALDSHITPTQAIHSRLCEKYRRLSSLLGGTPDLVGESVDETIRDLCAQALILLVRLQAEREFLKSNVPTALEDSYLNSGNHKSYDPSFDDPPAPAHPLKKFAKFLKGQ